MLQCVIKTRENPSPNVTMTTDVKSEGYKRRENKPRARDTLETRLSSDLYALSREQSDDDNTCMYLLKP